MTVHELITKLEKFPRFSEVLIDFTPTGSDHFVFAPTAFLDEVGMPNKEGEEDSVVVLSRQDFNDNTPDIGCFLPN